MTELSPEYELEHGERLEDSIEENKTKVYRFQIGKDTSITSVSVTLSLATTDLSKVQVYASGQKDPSFIPKSEESFIIMKTWLGYSLKISESTRDIFRRDWIYKIVIKSKVQTSFSLTYRSNKAVTVLTAKIADIYEPIQDSQYNCYQYKVKNSEDNLVISLTSYCGKSRILVNPLKLPDSVQYWNFQFKTNHEALSKGILIISPEDRAFAKALTGPYYICVYSEVFSYYNMLILMQNKKNQDRIPLYKGLTRSMSVKPGNFALFQYGLDCTEKIDLSFTLTSLSWGSTLYAKFCGDNSSCKFQNLTESDVLSAGLHDSTSNIFTSFDPKTTGCIGKDCFFLIGILADNSSNTNDANVWCLFSLTVTESTKTTTQLLSGVPYSGTLDLNEVMYFKYSVDNPAAGRVNFQLTPLSGMIDLIVNHTYPVANNNPSRTAFASSYYPEVVSYSRDDQDVVYGEYNITIKAKTPASYELTAATVGVFSVPLTLSDGHPQIGSFEQNQNSLLYVFGIAFPNDKQNDIVISLLPLSGVFQVYIMENYKTTPTNYTWSFHSTSGSLFIRKEDPNYKRCGTYYVLVTKISSDNVARFSLKYVSGKYVQNIIEGFPEYGNLTKNGIGFYKFYVLDAEEIMNIIITPLTGDSSTYVSANGLPSKTSYTYSTSEIGSDFLKISARELMSKTNQCREETLGEAVCAIYIGVFCASDACTYSLLLSRRNDVPLRLVSGIPQFGRIENSPAFYAFIPNVMNSATMISIQPTKGELTAYVKLVEWTRNFHYDSLTNHPTQQNHNITLESLASSDYGIILPSTLSACGKNCVLFIGLYKDANQQSSCEFTITASNGLNFLIEGQTIVDQVEDHTFKYYIFSTYCRNCTIFISVSDLSSGNPGVYANKGVTFPSLTTFDFAAATKSGEILTISPIDAFFKGSANATQGIYTIGIYGYRSSTYSLTVTTSELAYQELRLGMPTKQIQSQGEIKYFTFASWKRNSIIIRLAVHAGRVIIRANVIQKERDPNILKKFPTTDPNCTWSSSMDSSLNYLTISKDSASFLDNGIYLIGVEALDGTNYDIVAEYSDADDYTYLILGRPLHSYINATSKLKLAFFVGDYQNFTFKLDILIGNVKGTVLTNDGKSLGNLVPDGKLEIKSINFQNKKTLFIELTAIENSAIILRVYPELNCTYLDEGIPFSDALIPNNTISFIYNLPAIDLSKEDNVRFNVFPKFDQPLLNGTINVRQIVQVNKDKIPIYAWIQSTINYNSQLKELGDSILLNLSKSELVFVDVIAYFPPNISTVKYSISAWTNGIIMLNPGNWLTFYQEDKALTQIYEQIVDEPANISIEVRPCIGQNKFYVTHEYQENTKRNIDLAVRELHEGRLYGTFAAKPGKYFIFVTGNASISSNETALRYSIRTLLSYNSSSRITENFTVGNNGTIQIVRKLDKVHLEWEKVISLDKSIKEPLGEVYQIYIASADKMNMRTPCGIFYSNSELISSVTGETKYIYDVPHKYHKKPGVINILVTINSNKEVLAYNPVELPYNPEGDNFGLCKNYT